MNPRAVNFEGVIRPRVESPDALQRDLMREHDAIGAAFAAINENAVPRSEVVTQGPTRLSAQPWDFVIAPGGSTVYLPKADQGDEVTIGAVSGTVTVVEDTGVTVNGSLTISGPAAAKFVRAGEYWWRLG